MFALETRTCFTKYTIMKKLLFWALLSITISTISAENNTIAKVEWSYGYPYKEYKGNIAPEKLPKSIQKYLNENYPDHSVIVSKRKGNGNYFVKIRFGGNQYRSYYRGLVFDSEGSVIKG